MGFVLAIAIFGEGFVELARRSETQQGHVGLATIAARSLTHQDEPILGIERAAEGELHLRSSRGLYRGFILDTDRGLASGAKGGVRPTIAQIASDSKFLAGGIARDDRAALIVEY